MWKLLPALLLLAAPALAQENPSAYEALRVIGTQLNRDLVTRVISVTGTDGDPQPRTWKILVADRRAPNRMREIIVEGDQIVSQRDPNRSVAGSTEGHAFAGRLTELDLIEPVQIDVGFVDGGETKLQGLYWIAAAALKALSAAQLLELRDRGYLEWMYFQMASIAHVSGLVARKNRLLSAVAAAAR